MTRYFPRLIVAVLLGALVLGACGGDDDDDSANFPPPSIDRSENPWKVVVSMPLFASIAEAMGGDQVTVTSLLEPGEDPHTAVPDDELASAVQEANYTTVNGLGLDQPAIDFIEANRPARRYFMIDIVRDVPSPTTEQPIQGLPTYAKEAGDEPHLWLDPESARFYFESIEHSLVILDGENEAYFDARFADYRERLRELDAMITEEISRIPSQNRASVITLHPSLTHFANRYGLTVAGTLEEDGETRIREVIEARRPPAVFTEYGLDNSVLEGIADDLGVDVCELYTDTIEPGMDYFEMMEHNLEEIVDCLGG